MIFLSLFVNSELRFWWGVVTILIIALCYFIDALTGGHTLGYLKCKISKEAKSTILSFQVSLSLLLAAILPNHALNEIPFIKSYYDKNEFYVGLSALLLFIFFIMTSGLVITLQARKHGIEEKRKSKSIKK